jgi:hypothetical protein
MSENTDIKDIFYQETGEILEQLEQDMMVDVIKETFNIHINTMMKPCLVDKKLKSSFGMMCASVRSESVAMFMKFCFANRF